MLIFIFQVVFSFTNKSVLYSWQIWWFNKPFWIPDISN